MTQDDTQQVVVEIVASTTASMQASLSVTDEGYGNLLSDLDGDGEIDEEWTPQVTPETGTPGNICCFSD